MNEKSQEDPININIIENAFRNENITHLLQTLKITTSSLFNLSLSTSRTYCDIGISLLSVIFEIC